jgi:integration host factor subunit alpha
MIEAALTTLSISLISAPRAQSDYKNWKTQMTLTKAELTDRLFNQVGLNRSEAKDMVDAFFKEIGLALEGGDTVLLSGFGTFLLRDKPVRPGRNPKTGEDVQITARRVVTFRASKNLKSSVGCAAQTSYGLDHRSGHAALAALLRGRGESTCGPRVEGRWKRRTPVQSCLASDIGVACRG